jgi:hypothetical protein
LNAIETDANKTQSNLAILAIRQAADHNDVKYNLQDRIIDNYYDASGVDATPSTNHNLASGIYSSSTPSGNYFGSGADGVLSTSGNVTHTVLSKNGSYDGDMLVKNYTTLTINAGHTMTVDQPCRGMLIYVSGNCVINGTLTMTARGALGNPATSGGSDSANVPAAGIQLPMRTASGSSTLSAAGFAGCGSTAVTAVANQAAISSNGTIFTIARTGAALVASPTSGASNGRTDGNDGTTGQSGGGGSGARHEAYPGGDGAAGTCFSGGSGGGGGDEVGNSGDSGGGDAVAYGGAGGRGVNIGQHSNNGGGGGAGNPGGAASLGSPSNSTTSTVGENGTGGLLILVVGGTLSGSGAITSHGKDGGDCTSNDTGGGGGSGGGNILILPVTTTHSGARTATGGAGGTYGSNSTGGAGGDGSVQGPTLVQGDVIGNLTLQSTDTAAETEANYADMVVLMEDAAGTATVNTDIKGYISEDSGVTFTQGTLVDEGDWGTNKRILAFHDLDISAQSGTAMCYKITTHNQAVSKETKIHATSIGWR